MEEMKSPLEIVILVASGCPNCPKMVSAATQLAKEHPEVSVSVVDTAESPELASRYQVRSVPTTVVNDGLTIVGVVTKDELLNRLMALQTSGADDTIFASFVKSGRIDDATAYLVNGRGIAAFAELWNQSALEARIGLSLITQNAVDEEPSCLDSLVEHILPSMDAEDLALRGDTADLLGAIGHENARSALKKMLQDGDEDLAEVAADALESIAERNASNDDGGDR